MNKNEIFTQNEHTQTDAESVKFEQAVSGGKPGPYVNVKISVQEYQFDCDTFDEFTEMATETKEILHTTKPRFAFELRNGTPMEQELFAALNIDEAKLEIWFEQVEGMEDSKKAALFYLLTDCGRELEFALEKVDEVWLYQGDHVEAAEALFEDLYSHQVPDFLRGHIDYKSIAYDWRISGDLWEFQFGGRTYTSTNATQH